MASKSRSKTAFIRERPVEVKGRRTAAARADLRAAPLSAGAAGAGIPPHRRATDEQIIEALLHAVQEIKGRHAKEAA